MKIMEQVCGIIIKYVNKRETLLLKMSMDLPELRAVASDDDELSLALSE